ncbi:hypothetical protein DM01DRAFT_1148694 [Hesseltinella vesiculosa]|uniref:Uncharacterized protein n=1 Tax=Hesseltinella vesiculosa TaxID=101127 RepID=A0A1X2G775_9FUNG|nr:hypothetical protein DM01DRAFT_1148694 [Hesseltinella vesiculosa]
MAARIQGKGAGGRQHEMDDPFFFFFFFLFTMRLLDLAIGNKLAAYRYSTQDRHFPSDAKILWYVFKTYLEYEKPNTVPPLTGDDNDIFKFLLIYFYITDDLQREIFD